MKPLTEGNDSMRPHVKTVAIFNARPGKTEALKVLLQSMTAPSRAEPGNLRYDLWQEPTAPGRFVLDELYIDSAAIAQHRETSHFKSYLAQINEYAERTAIVLDPADVA